MREIIFYRTSSGNCPVEEFLDSLAGRQASKVTWVLRLIAELESVPKQYFKKLVDTDELWEVRVQIGKDIFRLLGFFDGPKILVVAHAFAKKTRKIPLQELTLTERRKREYFERRKRS